MSGAVGRATLWDEIAGVNPISGRSRISKFLKKEHSGIVVEKHSVLNYSLQYTARYGRAGGGGGYWSKTEGSVTISPPTC